MKCLNPRCDYAKTRVINSRRTEEGRKKKLFGSSFRVFYAEDIVQNAINVIPRLKY